MEHQAPRTLPGYTRLAESSVSAPAPSRREQGIHVDHVGGYTDHVHALVSLEPMQSVAGIAQFMKMESSRWLKEQQFVPDYFAWQTDYFAVSVSESVLGRVRAYIRNQEVHHQQQTFGDEHDRLLSRWGFV